MPNLTSSCYSQQQLYHNNDVQTLANFFFKVENKTSGESLMLLFRGHAPSIQNWANTLIALRNLAKETSFAADEIKQKALAIQAIASKQFIKTRPC